jgi:hypothetical protein
MTRYFISFDDGAMNFPDEDLPAVAAAAHEVLREAKHAGVWITGGGLHGSELLTIVAEDGIVRRVAIPGNKRLLGGFSIIEVPTEAEALEWAAKFAKACRCAQEVRPLMDDPEV